MKKSLLILSHAALAVLGGWLAFHHHAHGGASPPADASAMASSPHAVAATGKSEERSAHTNAGVWRAGWEKALLGSRYSRDEPPEAISYLISWSAEDPEGAVRGFSRIYAPHSSQNILGNAIQKNGAAMAPALVKHYREIAAVPGAYADSHIGRAINMLAKEDPAQAASLLGSLPPGARGRMYSDVFRQLSREGLDRVFTSMPAEAGADEMRRRSEAYASAVDTIDPQAGVWKGMAEADNSAVRKAFATEGVRKALRSEAWREFFDTVEKLDPAAREEVRGALKFNSPSSSGYPEKTQAQIAEECRRRGLDDWSVMK